MHELTIATSLIELACEEAARAGASRVGAIHIRLGALCGIARSLEFCFGPATRGTACEGSLLYIEEVALTVMCTHSHEIKKPRSLYNFRCPDCGRPTPGVVTGREMELAALELVAAHAEMPAGAEGGVAPGAAAGAHATSGFGR